MVKVYDLLVRRGNIIVFKMEEKIPVLIVGQIWFLRCDSDVEADNNCDTNVGRRTLPI
jgi:hypothetical protein